MKKLLSTLKQARLQKNYTQEYLASELNISVRSYRKIESGETELTVSRLQHIARILEVDPVTFIEAEKPKPEKAVRPNEPATPTTRSEAQLISIIDKQITLVEKLESLLSLTMREKNKD